MARHTSMLIAAGVALVALGCNDQRTYIGPAGVYQVALTADTPAAFENDDDAIYIIEKRVEVPVLRPSNTQLQDLMNGASRYPNLPFPRLPWVERGDLEMQIEFTLSNLDNQEHEVAVIVNGFNEFDEYVPGVKVIDDALVPDFAQWERLYKLEPLERLTRTIREEELDEVAVDLATVVNGAPNSNQIVFFENTSGHDPRAKPFIPAVIPGLIGFRFGMRATGAGSLLLEASVRVRDAGDRLADSSDRLLEVEPEPFTPVAPEEP